MARLLQSTVLGAIDAELRDPAIPVTDAQFSRSGNVRDFWTERLDARDEQVALTWYKLGEPFLVHTQPNAFRAVPTGCARCSSRRSAHGSPAMELRRKAGPGRGIVKVARLAPACWDYAKVGRRPYR